MLHCKNQEKQKSYAKKDLLQLQSQTSQNQSFAKAF